MLRARAKSLVGVRNVRNVRHEVEKADLSASDTARSAKRWRACHDWHVAFSVQGGSSPDGHGYECTCASVVEVSAM